MAETADTWTPADEAREAAKGLQEHAEQTRDGTGPYNPVVRDWFEVAELLSDLADHPDAMPVDRLQAVAERVNDALDVVRTAEKHLAETVAAALNVLLDSAGEYASDDYRKRTVDPWRADATLRKWGCKVPVMSRLKARPAVPNTGGRASSSALGEA